MVLRLVILSVVILVMIFPPEGRAEEPVQWTVHIGSYKLASNLKFMADRVKRAQLNSFTQEIKTASGQVLTRLLVGPFDQPETANAALIQLKGHHLDGRLFRLAAAAPPSPAINTGRRDYSRPSIPADSGSSINAPELSVIELVHRSREAAGARDLGEALKWARASVAKDPAYSEAWKQLGRVLMLKGEYQEALASFQFALDLKPEDREIQEWVLRALLASDRIDELVERLEKIPPRWPEGLDAQWVLDLLSRAYALKDKGQTARIREVVRRKAGSPGRQTALEALNLISEGRLEEAEKRLSTTDHPVQPDGPFLGFAWFILGQAYLDLPESPKAIAAFQMARSLHPDYLPAYRELGWALKRSGKGTEAAEVWAQGLQKDPGHPLWLLWIAETRLENRQPDLAFKALENLLKTEPSNRKALALKLTALILARNEPEIRTYQRQLGQRTGGDRLVALGRILALQYQGQYPEASRRLEALYRLYPRDPGIRELLLIAYRLWAANSPGKSALEPLQKLVALEPGQSGAWRDLGWSLLAHNRLPEAVQAWERALQDPAIDRRRLIRQTVASLAEEGQEDQARKLFQRWEPGASFLALGIEHLKTNRVIAARVFLTAAWEAGEERPLGGLYLAYAEARTGYCSLVPEHLTPFINSGLPWGDPHDRSYLLTALSQCSQEPDLFPVLVRLDQLLSPFPELGQEVTGIIAKGAAERRRILDLERAWILYQKTLERDPNRVQDWLPAAETAVDLGRQMEALALLKSLVARTGSEAVGEGIKGWLADSRNETESAATHYRNSIKVEPAQPDLRFLLFKDLLILRRYEEAGSELLWFKERVASGEGPLRGYLAETLTALGKTEEALVYWQELSLANPEKAHYTVETARALFLLGRAPEALQLLESLLSRSPDPKAFELAAEIQRDLSRLEEVMTLTQRGLSSLPTTGLWQLRAEAAEGLKQPSPALESAKSWLASDPGSIPANLIQAKALLDLGKYDEAQEFLEGLLRRNPVFLPGLIHLREIASTRNDTGQAVNYSRQIVELRPWDKNAELHHSISLAQDERFVAALKTLRPIAAVEPHRAIPILIYRNVTTYPYPGRNTVLQVLGHLQRLADQGYTFITPSDLADALKQDQPRVMVVIVNTGSDPLLKIDETLKRLQARAVLACDSQALQVEVPHQAYPEILSQLQATGRWVMASVGITGNNLRARVDEKGTLGNVLTHKIMLSGGRENPEDLSRRLEKIFSQASEPFRRQPSRIFLYPGGDYGQNSLDTDPETIDRLYKTVQRHFDFAISSDPNGFITAPLDPWRLAGRSIPPGWGPTELANYLSRQNPLVRSRLELAKILFWQGQQSLAGRWFQEAEALGADPEEVNYHWGNNAYQAGDLPTALSKLRLARDLNPESARNQDSLERAEWRKKWFINPAGTYWRDSDRRTYSQGGLTLGGHLSDTFQLEFFGDRMHWERKELGYEEGYRQGVGGKWYFHPGHWLDGRIWLLDLDKGENRWGGLINLHWLNPLWEGFVDFQAAREQIDTVEAVRAGIEANRYGLYTYSRAIDSFDLFANLAYTQRTDENNTLLFNGRLVWRLKEWPYLGFGYLIRLGDSDRKVSEYYSPKNLQQHQLYFNSRGEYGLLHYKFSLQSGYAREETTEWRFVWGAQLDLDLRLTRRLELNGRLSRQQTPTYDFDEFSLGFRFRF